jgi:hypothetical protein
MFHTSYGTRFGQRMFEVAVPSSGVFAITPTLNFGEVQHTSDAPRSQVG